MANGQAVLVITQGLGGGDPQYTLYYVAEADAAAAERIVASLAAPNEKVTALAPIPEPMIKALGLKPREFRQAWKRAQVAPTDRLFCGGADRGMNRESYPFRSSEAVLQRLIVQDALMAASTQRLFGAWAQQAGILPLRRTLAALDPQHVEPLMDCIPLPLQC